MMDEQDIEYTILNRRDVNAFQVPPQTSAGGHRAEEWSSQCIWSGKIWVAAKGKDCIVRLTKPATEELFLQSVILGGDYEKYVERTVDSSRYFVLRVVHPQTKKAAFIGLGFEDRNDAFDFNCCLADHKSAVNGAGDDQGAEGGPQATGASGGLQQEPSRDYSLKEGQKFTIKMKNVKPGGAGGAGGNKIPPRTPGDGDGVGDEGTGAGGNNKQKQIFLPPPPAAVQPDFDPFENDGDFFGDFQSG
mmetsp:Transcript_22396/g.56601  ORF Transcript_22396/g.56601 Transcript_22396/m.56601 type:complete len:246 (-) Transcript_22396:8-745(-)